MAEEGIGSLRADVVVVAAGSSRRMAGTDKLMAEIGGRPLLAWTLAGVCGGALRRSASSSSRRRSARTSGAALRGCRPRVTGVVRAAPRAGSPLPPGCAGSTPRIRQDGDRPVLVHDGARPLVSPALVAAVAEAAERHGAALPVLAVAETLKRVGRAWCSRRWTAPRSPPPRRPGRASRPAARCLGGVPARRPAGVHRRGRPARGL